MFSPNAKFIYKVLMKSAACQILDVYGNIVNFYLHTFNLFWLRKQCRKGTVA